MRYIGGGKRFVSGSGGMDQISQLKKNSLADWINYALK